MLENIHIKIKWLHIFTQSCISSHFFFIWHFDWWPESAEIVSTDAFNRPEPSKGLVVGISLILLKVILYYKALYISVYEN